MGNRDLIKRFDYLSTVSGGGYIGTTLSIGLSEGRGFPFGRGSTEAGETPITRHIRDNTRYLFPNGFSSIVTALVVYLRGLAMNLLVVLPVMLASAAVMVFFTPTMDHLKGAKWPERSSHPARSFRLVRDHHCVHSRSDRVDRLCHRRIDQADTQCEAA